MNLTHDAMLVSLRISAWSGRLYDRKASNHVAVHHEASASAGRYNKCLLPKAAFAALTATMSKARSSHYEQTLPWDDQGSRLLTVANYEHYMQLLDGLREGIVKLIECRLFSAFLHEAKLLNLRGGAIDNVPRFRSESG